MAAVKRGVATAAVEGVHEAGRRRARGIGERQTEGHPHEYRRGYPKYGGRRYRANDNHASELAYGGTGDLTPDRHGSSQAGARAVRGVVSAERPVTRPTVEGIEDIRNGLCASGGQHQVDGLTGVDRLRRKESRHSDLRRDRVKEEVMIKRQRDIAGRVYRLPKVVNRSANRRDIPLRKAGIRVID